jgi:zeta-carotene desaturase
VTPDAIVIGAGVAGLSAATALAERGQRVLVLEARPGLGGRATAFTDPATGERVDNGQHVLFGCYHETFRFLHRIGTDAHVTVQPRLEVEMIDRQGGRSRLRCPSLPPPWHLLAGLVSWKALSWRDRLAATRMRDALAQGGPGPEGGLPARETVREWLVRHGQTSRAVEMLWEPLAVAALNESIDVAAAAPFAKVLSLMFGPDPRSAALALPAKPLDELYAIPAKQYLEERGGTIETGALARVEIEREGQGAVVIVADRRFAARATICAVPWYALPEVFAAPPAALRGVLTAAASTNASPIVTVNLWFDRPVLDQPFLGLPGRTMQWVFDKGRVFGKHSTHLSLIVSGAAHIVERGNQDLIGLAVREVSDALPAARTAALVRGVVVRERRATFSVAPGQPPRPSVETGVPGLFLAGDWIDTGLPATIESAVVSGHRAAAAAARSVV